NYGDQIREISQDLAQENSGVTCDELEAAIDRLIAGGDAEGGALEGKEYAAICRKVKKLIDSNCARIDGLEQRNEAERRAYAHAALAYGRIMEAIGGASEELLAITNLVGELASAAESMTSGVASARKKSAGSPDKAVRIIVSEMESSVRKLEDGAHVLNEFSEENNGIAINLALMAARGHVDEHDLATFAERVRSTAERFHRLSGTVSNIAQGLLGGCYTLKEQTGASTPEAPAVEVDGLHAIVEIARRIEGRGADLQKQLCNLGNELQDVHELLQKDFTGTAPSAPDLAPRREGTLPAEPAPSGRGSGTVERHEKAPDFVVDHGTSWSGIDVEKPPTKPAAKPDETFSFKHLDEALGRPAPEEQAAESEATSDFSDMSSLRELRSPAEIQEQAASRPQEPRESGSWMEMPGHRWLKIDVEKSEPEEEAGKIDVTVQNAAPETVHSESAAGGDGGESVFEAVEEPPFKTDAGADDDPIYDLLDLGAVEYVEETPTRR
ncbi:MAG TPA: hypothetical protein VMT60_03580, partial [Candidatus Bathyarchaeia archaeon]|nr:hypothetical protein [Candidatus Bathyarchaeia archaeon]